MQERRVHCFLKLSSKSIIYCWLTRAVGDADRL